MCFRKSKKVCFAGMANPWCECDNSLIKRETGIEFNIPTDASEISFSFCKTISLFQMDFSVNGSKWTARIKKSGKLNDISGMYFTWSDAFPSRIKHAEGTIRTAVSDTDTVISCLWFDKKRETVLSLSSVRGTAEEAVDLANIIF